MYVGTQKYTFILYIIFYSILDYCITLEQILIFLHLKKKQTNLYYLLKANVEHFT